VKRARRWDIQTSVPDGPTRDAPPAPGRPPLDWSGKAPFPFTRESSIRLDEDGRFHHEGIRVEHPGLIRAMHRWITRHPIDGRYVLENGWDWCYLTVDDAPYVVRAANVASDGSIELALSDDSIERVDPRSLRVDGKGVLRCEVKRDDKGGPFPARFDRHAIVALGEKLREENGAYVLSIDGRDVALARE
jgi:hypothetical protein